MKTQQTTIKQHQYQVHLIPADMAPEDVEQAHAAKLLPVKQFPAPDAEWAMKSAHHITGLAVHSVERIDADARQTSRKPSTQGVAA